MPSSVTCSSYDPLFGRSTWPLNVMSSVGPAMSAKRGSTVNTTGSSMVAATRRLVTGTLCHPATHVCVPFPLAVAHAGAGEPCDLAANPPVGCVGQLVCLAKDRTQSAGTCTAPSAAGQPCLDGASPRCGTGLAFGL